MKRPDEPWLPEAGPNDPNPDLEMLAAELKGFNLLFAPGHLLRRSHQRSYDLFSQRVGDALTRQQAALLIALAQKPHASQSDLVAEIGIDKSTLKEMLGRMTAKGLVLRERDPHDSRAWRLSVAPEGAQLLASFLPRIAAVQRDILAPLPEADRPVFIRMLRILVGLEEPN